MINLYTQKRPDGPMVLAPTTNRYSSTYALFSRLGELSAYMASTEQSLHYMVCSGGPGERSGKELCQWFWDVEECDYGKMDEYMSCFANCFDIPLGDFSVVQSGYGLHFIVHLRLSDWIPTESLPNYRLLYKASCDRFRSFLEQYNLPGKIDLLFPSPAKLLRVPGSANLKDGLCVFSSLYYLATKEISFDIKKVRIYEKENPEHVSGSQTMKQTTDLSTTTDSPCIENVDIATHAEVARVLEEVSPLDGSPLLAKKKAFANYYNDTKAVLSGCKFLDHMKENQESATYPEWFAMLSVLSRLDQSERLAVEYSHRHPKYTYEETVKKLQEVSKSDGPVKCETVEGLWGGCSECLNYKKVATPCNIKATDFIASEQSGFWRVEVLANGKTKHTAAYEDLVKKYNQDNILVNVLGSGPVLFNGKFYESYFEEKLENWCYETMKSPKPRSAVTSEFSRTLMNQRMEAPEFLTNHGGKLCLSNGVYDIVSHVLEPHHPRYGFTGEMPYAYDPLAKCPLFDKFLQDVVSEEDGKSILEYLANAMSGTPISPQRMLLFIGTGANGKSTLLKVVKHLFGGFYTPVTANCITTNFGRLKLVGKLIATWEEVDAFLGRQGNNTSVWNDLKPLVSLDDMVVARKGKDERESRSTARFILTANKMPESYDNSDGFYRRFHFIEFNRSFYGEARVVDLAEQIIESELPGIFNKLMAVMRVIAKQKYEVSISERARAACEDFRIIKDDMYRFVTDNFMPSGVGCPVDKLPQGYFAKDGLVYVSYDKLHEQYMEFRKEEGLPERMVGRQKFAQEFFSKVKHWKGVDKWRGRDPGQNRDTLKKRFFVGIIPKIDD